MNLKKQTADLIKELRKSKGLTQRELGDKLGISESAASRLLNGKQNLTLESIEKIGKVLNVEFTLNYK